MKKKYLPAVTLSASHESLSEYIKKRVLGGSYADLHKRTTVLDLKYWRKNPRKTDIWETENNSSRKVP